MLKPLLPVALPLLLLGALTACSTRTESNPSRTATEQMLISSAADRAADKLFVDLLPGTKVFVDGSYFEGTDSKYALGSIRASLLKHGAALVAERKEARLVVEVRAGALSTDQTTLLIGIPAISIPIPLASGPLPFPEIALYKNSEQKGVAKFAITAYQAKDGKLVTAQDPQYGFAHNDSNTVLFFFSWTDSDALPKEDKDAFTRHTENFAGDLSGRPPGSPAP